MPTSAVALSQAANGVGACCVSSRRVARSAASRIPRRAGSRTMARGSHRRPTARLALLALVLSLLCRGQPAASQETLSTFLGDLGLGDAEAPFAGRHALQCHSSLPVLRLRTRVRLC